MKRVIIMLVMLSACMVCKAHADGMEMDSSQYVDSAAIQHTARIYHRRNKVLKACAWTSLSIGTVATAGGFYLGVMFTVADVDENLRNSLAPGIIMISGFTLMVGSIPMFIFAHKNKKKYRALQRISVGTGMLKDPLPAGSVTCAPCLTARFSF